MLVYPVACLDKNNLCKVESSIMQMININFIIFYKSSLTGLIFMSEVTFDDK